ncbi:MAG: YciI-like protein [Spirochaetia bacterium]
MQHYLLFYDVAEDYVARRAEFRARHLELAWKAHDRGELVLGGALADPVDGAILLFAGESPEAAERFARADPYVTEGLVTRWRVRSWSTVVGSSAAAPVRPGTGAAPLRPGDAPRARA